MAHPARRHRNKKNNKYDKRQDINKSSPPPTGTLLLDGGRNVKPNRSKFVRKGSIGTNAIDSIQKWTIGLKPFELQFPQNTETFHEMYTRDDSVGGVLNATYALVEKAFSKYKLIANPDNEQSKNTADLIKFFFENMSQGTMRSFARNAATFNQFGFSVIEKDYEKFKPEMYQGEMPSQKKDGDSWWMIDRLMFLPQRSLDPSEPFVIGDEGREILALRQNSQWFLNSSHALRNWTPPARTVTIRRNKFILMGMNVTDSNPMGVSPLEQVWTAYKEKKFYESYQATGVSKDMAGMPLLEIPLDILDKAAADPNSPEGMLVDSLCKDVASMHAGEQNMMMLPSDLQQGSSNNKDYGLSFLGVSGQGKQFDLQEIINKRRESIYASFGALNLISNESKGGYNQLEGQNAIHLHFVDRIICIIEEAINKDLIPQLISINNIDLGVEDFPKFKASPIESVSLEELSKTIQRIGSIGFYPQDKDFFNEILDKTGWDYRIPDGMSNEEVMGMMSQNVSRSGESGGTSGTGNTQMVSGGDGNLENTG